MIKEIKFTDKALKQINSLLSKKDKGSFFRIAIKGGGCSGFQYDFSFSKFDISDMEIIFIGMGVCNNKLNNSFKDFFTKNNIIIECLTTPTACRAYNITISNERKAGALLIPI